MGHHPRQIGVGMHLDQLPILGPGEVGALIRHRFTGRRNRVLAHLQRSRVRTTENDLSRDRVFSDHTIYLIGVHVGECGHPASEVLTRSFFPLQRLGQAHVVPDDVVGAMAQKRCYVTVVPSSQHFIVELCQLISVHGDSLPQP